MGKLKVELQRTKLTDLQKAFGGTIQTDGDGAGRADWLCYHGDGTNNWFISNALGGYEFVMMVAVEAASSRPGDCDAAPARTSPAVTFGMPGLGAKTADLKAKFGAAARQQDRLPRRQAGRLYRHRAISRLCAEGRQGHRHRRRRNLDPDGALTAALARRAPSSLRRSPTQRHRGSCPSPTGEKVGEARMRGLGHPLTRQIDHGPHARRIVLDAQLALVQPGDGGHQRQAEAGARLGAALFEPDPALDHAVAILGRNAGAIVGDLDQHPALRAEPDGDAAGLALGRLVIFQRILDQVDQRLPEQFAIAAAAARPRRDLGVEHQPLVLGQRP